MHTGVDIQNPGCLNESGRKSVNIKLDVPGFEEESGLVYSPAQDCNCQQTCDQIVDVGCHVLNSSWTANTMSFRFQNSGESKDACLNDSEQNGDNC